MIKDSKGITLVSLVITIALMLIISSITISVSMDRFEINDYNKMINDLKLLEDKVSNYYLKYNAIPIVRDKDNNNNPILYDNTKITFDTNKNDNGVYYILDLSAMEGISLNYGEEFENKNYSSDDVYIINEKSHQIYYVKGVELKGNVYHSIIDNNTISDNIPPSKPEIKIVSGAQNEEGIYITEVKIEIIPGKDNWSGTDKTTIYIVTDVDNNSAETTEEIMEGKIITLTENGTYEIRVNTSDVAGNTSDDITKTLNINIPAEIVNEISNTIE